MFHPRYLWRAHSGATGTLYPTPNPSHAGLIYSLPSAFPVPSRCVTPPQDSPAPPDKANRLPANGLVPRITSQPGQSNNHCFLQFFLRGTEETSELWEGYNVVFARCAKHHSSLPSCVSDYFPVMLLVPDPSLSLRRFYIARRGHLGRRAAFHQIQSHHRHDIPASRWPTRTRRFCRQIRSRFRFPRKRNICVSSRRSRVARSEHRLFETQYKRGTFHRSKNNRRFEIMGSFCGTTLSFRTHRVCPGVFQLYERPAMGVHPDKRQLVGSVVLSGYFRSLVLSIK
jgi:hypothetical protein